MKIGTKSVLFGAHQFLIHPWFVAAGWYQLHGFKPVLIGTRSDCLLNGIFSWRGAPVYASLWKPQLWLAFFVHDVGYLGKPNMDGVEGEQHPSTGAAIMRTLCGEPWGKFAFYHSRFLAKQHGVVPSALCIADKLAIALTPAWLYLPLVRLTGEIDEYMAKSAHMNETGGKYAGMQLALDDQRQWHRDMCEYVRRWVEEHKDGRDDTWTPNSKETIGDSGVWK